MSDDKPRQIRLSIAPATATTCGDGLNFCPLVQTAAFGTGWECLIWGSLEDVGWLMRHPKCLDAEREQNILLVSPGSNVTVAKEETQ